jgi:uncharacterized protein YkwD
LFQIVECALGVVRGAIFVSDAALLVELNRLRANPAAYADELVALARQFDGTLLLRPGLAPIQTSEGVVPVAEAIALLRATPPLPLLTASAALALAADEHCRDQAHSGGVGHQGQDGSNSFARVARHGRVDGLFGEVIGYGWSTAREIVIDLLVDDAVANRGHRRALLRPQFAQAGAACGAHPRFGVMCTIEVAERFAADSDVVAVSP